MSRKSKYTGKFQVGHTFGSWTVTDGTVYESPAKLNVRCVCGTEKLMDIYSMTSGRSQSCGCKLKERTGENNPNWKGSHGISATSLYNNSRTSGLSYDELLTVANNQSGGGANTASSFTVAYSSVAPIDIDKPMTVDNAVWVNQNIGTAAKSIGIRNLISASNSISQVAPNIFERLGFKSTNGEDL